MSQDTVLPTAVKLAPSILACDFTQLGSEIGSVRSAEYLHVDVMDGLFVPNISFGVPILEAARRSRDALGIGQAGASARHCPPRAAD